MELMMGTELPDVPVAIEEDGDEVFTTVRHCVVWPCSAKKQPLVVRNGFRCCPLCGGSYGPAPMEKGHL